MTSSNHFRSEDYLREVALANGMGAPSSPSMFRKRRDRHGRGPRGPQFHPALPAWRTRREQFYEEMVRAVTEMAAREPAVANIEFGIQEVPPSDPADWEDHETVLSRVFPSDRRRGLADRIIVYRHPIMSRATQEELPVALRIIVAQRVSEVLAVEPEDLLGWGPLD